MTEVDVDSARGAERFDPLVVDLPAAAARGMAIAWTAARSPERPALLGPRGQRTYAELDARADQLARALRSGGVAAGIGVALLCSNRPEFAETWAANLRAGGRMTPINWHLTPSEVAYIVDDCEARVLVVEACFRPQIQEVLQGVLGASRAATGERDVGHPQSSRHLQAVLVIDLQAARTEDAKAWMEIERAAERVGVELLDFETALGKQPTGALTDPVLGSSMLYTSGTTGRPKGVFKQPQPRPLALHGAVRDSAALDPSADLALVTGPLYHAAPLNLNFALPINAGVGVVIMDKWDAEETLRLIARHKVTHSHFVATMFHRMLQLPEATRRRYDTGSLRWALHGAAPTPAHVKQAMIDWWGPVLWEYYAATEGGSYYVDSHEWQERPGTVGRPLPGTRAVVLDDDGRAVAAGDTGTVYFEAQEYGRFEYFKDPEKTAAAYRGNLFTMGDRGRLDEDGYLFLTGRSAETIISGGVNIYPQEIDDVLHRHPAVHEVCTIGVPSEEWGESVLSVVELRDEYLERTADEVRAELEEFCREHLPRYKQPRQIVFDRDLPRLPTGKIQRHKVRAPYWQGRDRSI